MRLVTQNEYKKRKYLDEIAAQCYYTMGCFDPVQFLSRTQVTSLKMPSCRHALLKILCNNHLTTKN